MSLKKLREKCKELKLNAEGEKEELIERLITEMCNREEEKKEEDKKEEKKEGKKPSVGILIDVNNAYVLWSSIVEFEWIIPRLIRLTELKSCTQESAEMIHGILKQQTDIAVNNYKLRRELETYNQRRGVALSGVSNTLTVIENEHKKEYEAEERKHRIITANNEMPELKMDIKEFVKEDECKRESKTSEQDKKCVIM
jgi:hypothetical protein